MNIRDNFATAAAIALAAAWMSSGAFAFCGNVQASATGDTEQEAIAIANDQGLRETRKLDSNYGGSVRYNPARVNCQESDVGYHCTITQKFCVDGAQARPAGGEPWNNPRCRKWKRQCAKGKNSACGKYESNCQND